MSVPVIEPVPLRDLPALRLLPAPVPAPDFDVDTEPVVVRALQPVVPGTRPPLPLRPLRLVPPLPDEDDDDAWSRPRTALQDLAPAQPVARAFVQRLLEVLAGVRPVAQLQRDTSPEVFARLERWTAARPGVPAGPRPDARAVRSVHVQTAPEGVMEACATVKRQTPRGPRVGAFALRFEGLEGHWCCTELLGL